MVPHDRGGRHRARSRHQHRARRLAGGSVRDGARRTRWSRPARRSAPCRTPATATSSSGPAATGTAFCSGVRPRSMTRAFSALGRETFVTPVHWQDDGWPTIDPVAAQPAPRHRGSRSTSIRRRSTASGSPSADPARRSPTSPAPGWLVLRGDGSTMDDPHPVFLGRRQEHLTNSVTIAIDVFDRRRRIRRSATTSASTSRSRPAAAASSRVR